MPGLHDGRGTHRDRQREQAQRQAHADDPLQHHAWHLRQDQVRFGRREDRTVEGRADQRHAPLQAERGQVIIDRPTRQATARHRDVVARGKALGADLLVEQWMILARGAHERGTEQVLHLGIGRMLAGGADVQVDPALRHRIVVGIAFGHEAQHRARRLLAEHLAQATAKSTDEHIIGAHAEGSLEHAHVHFTTGVEDAVGLLDHIADLLAQLQRAGVGARPRPARTSTGSPSAVRIRPRVRLIAGALRFMRRARRPRCIRQSARPVPATGSGPAGA
jgi:hypothetical protein